MDFKKHYRRRMKRLKQSFIEPIEQSRAVKQMWKLMGTQGMIFHMARQGRWNVWLAFVLSLASMGLVLGGIALANQFGTPWWSWFFIAPPIAIAAFLHYALWRATSHMTSGFMSLVLRLYAIPMLALLFCLVVGAVVVGLNYLLDYFLHALKGSSPAGRS